MSVAGSLVDSMRQEVCGAGFGRKGETIEKWAQILGLSEQQVRRQIKGDRTDRTDRTNQQYKDWTTTIFQIKKRPPQDAGEISTEDAARIAALNGLIPEEAMRVPRSTFDRIARQMGLTKTQRKIWRFQAEYPNQAHHFDASTSKFLYVHRKEGNEYVLRAHRPAKHYKNKPLPEDRVRPWIYGLVDDHSGYHVARYTMAQGESLSDSLLFLAYAWAEVGIPERLFADQGVLKRGLPSADLIARLGVDLPQMMPYAKEGHGKIERPWRTCWQSFEKQFFAVDDWEKFEIRESELNGMLGNYLKDRYNKMPHRFERDITREQAWRRINLRGGLVKIPENALATVARRERRKVDPDSTLEYKGRVYEVKGLYEAWVKVYEGVFEDRLVVEEEKTGQKYEVKKFRPLALDEFKASPKTAHQRAVEEGRGLQITKLLYEGRGTKEEGREKVVNMPIREQEAAPLEDPFDVTVYPNIQEAMKDLVEIVGTWIHPEQRSQIEELIRESGLKKEFVRELGMQLFEAKERKRKAM